MKKINVEITIKAPVEKVWDIMFTPKTYQEWTSHFGGSSRYEGKWETGSEMKFIGVDETGKEGGMYSKIKEARLHEYVSIEHLGMISSTGEIDTTSDEAKKWTSSFENYTFEKLDSDTTRLLVDMDTADDYEQMFFEAWPKALAKLKSLCEK